MQSNLLQIKFSGNKTKRFINDSLLKFSRQRGFLLCGFNSRLEKVILYSPPYNQNDKKISNNKKDR